MENDLIFEVRYFHIPCGTIENAKFISETVIKSRLAACSHISEIKSSYLWDNQLQSEIEFLLILKTTPEFEGALSIMVRNLHQYEVPCILIIKANVNESYYRWMLTQLS
ncbi:MAG: divalent-cation tolerance protein CutA [Saprospiraceae bacterium]|nr:divalent-cation tolerance protein CutA [Saprospiraceae bacterium]MBK7812380.1 divalent-cation tolerance protein CutA [Saprospiraceae bacterium]MBK9632396.1 divalent-cation tolerance protein CutA [Saprospiraceae bacterium]